MSENKVRLRNQNIMMENREKMTVTGVENVESFNENTIVLTTIKGGMIIKGNGMNISKLNIEDGSVRVEGHINNLNYTAKDVSTKNIIGKLFK